MSSIFTLADDFERNYQILGEYDSSYEAPESPWKTEYHYSFLDIATEPAQFSIGSENAPCETQII